MGWQAWPLTEATSSRTSGATERIWRSTAAQVDGTGDRADGDAPAGRSSRPLIRPRASTAMLTRSLVDPFAVTMNPMARGVLVVIESSCRLLSPARLVLSSAAGT